MSRLIRLACIPFALAALSSCKESNPKYCEGHPDDLDRCPPPDAGLCTADDQCGDMVCDTTSGACVECTTDKAGACTGATPVCGSDQTCQACTSHAQCVDSSVCLPSGACGNASEVAYVSASGSGTACTRTSPCPLLKDAVGRSLAYVKIASDGPANDTAPIVIEGKTVTILAEPGATIDREGDGPILEVKGANTNVSIYDVTITGASTASGDGILVTPNGGDPQLSLTRAKVDGNQGGGISSSGGSVTVTQSTVSSNQGGGISSSGGSVTVTQSTVSSNQGGGIAVSGSGATFTITNNFIYRNGNSTTATVGGASLAPSGTSVFEFNTVVDNQIQNSGVLAAGVFCDASGFLAANNVIARNFVNNDPNKANSNTSGLCTYPTSHIASAVTGLEFVSPDDPPHDYKVLAGSSAIDQATTTSPVAVDYDGDARPQGAAKDIGADEYKP